MHQSLLKFHFINKNKLYKKLKIRTLNFFQLYDLKIVKEDVLTKKLKGLKVQIVCIQEATTYLIQENIKILIIKCNQQKNQL